MWGTLTSAGPTRVRGCLRAAVCAQGTHPHTPSSSSFGVRVLSPCLMPTGPGQQDGALGVLLPPVAWFGQGAVAPVQCKPAGFMQHLVMGLGASPCQGNPPGAGTVAVLAVGDAETTPWGILGTTSPLPSLQRGLSARLGPAPCPAAARGSLMSLAQTTASQPSAPRALAWAPWRNDDTSRLARALRNAERGRTAPGEQSPAPPGEPGGGQGAGDPLCPLPGDGSEGSACWWWGCAGTSAVGMLGVPAASPQTAPSCPSRRPPASTRPAPTSSSTASPTCSAGSSTCSGWPPSPPPAAATSVRRSPSSLPGKVRGGRGPYKRLCLAKGTRWGHQLAVGTSVLAPGVPCPSSALGLSSRYKPGVRQAELLLAPQPQPKSSRSEARSPPPG